MASTKIAMIEARRNKKDSERIHRLIVKLVSLVGSEETTSQLVPYGDRAVKALKEYLLKGKPGSVYQPRQRAVFALAALGARDVLIEYLRMPQEIADPVVRFAEEAVQSSAARELVRWKDEETFRFLMEFSIKKRLTGALEALSEFQRPESAPVFIAAIEDDYYRPAGEKGLRKLGDAAKPYLIRAALTPSIDEGDELLRSVQRRQTALSLLVDTHITKEDWQILRVILSDKHPEIVAGIGTLSAQVAPKKDRERAARQIISVYPAADYWWTIMELETCLMRLQPEAAVAIDYALKRDALKNNSEAMKRLVLIRKKMRL
jgi:hypothetical protein